MDRRKARTSSLPPWGYCHAPRPYAVHDVSTRAVPWQAATDKNAAKHWSHGLLTRLASQLCCGLLGMSCNLQDGREVNPVEWRVFWFGTYAWVVVWLVLAIMTLAELQLFWVSLPFTDARRRKRVPRRLLPGVLVGARFHARRKVESRGQDECCCQRKQLCGQKPNCPPHIPYWSSRLRVLADRPPVLRVLTVLCFPS